MDLVLFLLLSNIIFLPIQKCSRVLQDLKASRKTMNYTDKFNLTSPTKVDNSSREDKQRRLFDKIRQVISSSNTPIERFYQDMDTNQSGSVSNLEFINAVKKLNVGLSLKEIEELIVYLDANQDGMISFQEFARRFAPQYVFLDLAC